MEQEFIRACLSHSVLPQRLLVELLRDLCEAYDKPPIVGPHEISEFVDSVNERLNKYNQALTFFKHPIANEEYLVFGLTKSMHSIKYQEQYNEVDRHVFESLELIIGSQPGFAVPKASVCSIALNMLPQKPTLARFQELLDKWTMQGYFLEKDDMLYFGPRMLVEFEPALKSRFSHSIKPCPLCKRIVLWDLECSECEQRVHVDCMRKYLRKKSNCPACSKPWNQPLNVSQP